MLVRGRTGLNLCGAAGTEESIDINLESTVRRFRFTSTIRTDLIGTRTWVCRGTGRLLSRSAFVLEALEVGRTFQSGAARTIGVSTLRTIIRIGRFSGTFARTGVTRETIRTVSVFITLTV